MSKLISKIKLKNAEAITLLYNRYGKKLYGYAIHQWKLNEDEAWDIVYKTLYRVIDVVGNYEFEDENKFGGFVFKIFVNYLRNHYRDNKNKTIEIVESIDAVENITADKNNMVEDVPSENKKINYLQEELDKHEDWERILLLMRAQDFSYEEIGKYVNKPATQLKVYYMRLKKRLTDKLNLRLNNL